MLKIKLAYQRLRQKEYHIRFLLVTILVILFFPKAFSQQQTSVSSSKANRPNFVIIMADDLDSRQLSCYGGENLQTTHIDRLAQEGLKFNNLIASEAMCVPTRASLFTGLYPLRHGAYQNHKPVYPDVKSVAHYLQELGYRVGLTGKDHVTKPKSSFPFQLVPGFEKNCVATTDEYFLDSIADFIQEDKDPYCLFVMSVNPHAPWTVGDTAEFDKAKLKLPAHWVDTDLTRRQFVKYLAEVRRLDNQVGDVLQLLEANKQLENTIVIFLGEQGPQFPGGKWTLYDNGQRSAMLVRWPGTALGGATTNAIVQYEDITPTLVAIAGGEPLKSLDGRSFLPVIKDSQNTFREYAFGIHNNIPEGPAYPIRSIRNNRFKLIVNLNSDQMYRIKYMTDTANRQQVYTSWVRKGENDETARRLAQRIVKHPPVEFYDLQQDPNELHDLSGNESYFTAIDEMRTELFKWMEAQGDTGAGLDVPIKRHKQ
ncbi:sulfatase family protein [Sphingobacterium pedocola]|uniref:Heparan N-sulfatase n=1 Tax=Sphingobacterium pedocola TaxID=2082722 RepID=A0ABR9T7E9_9SPHI|nr:sulfatase [Sphingobacterium pedocola]MBE8721256.1 heparan N-sulfatase [Sphingobacterium pedocola]